MIMMIKNVIHSQVPLGASGLNTEVSVKALTLDKLIILTLIKFM